MTFCMCVGLYDGISIAQITRVVGTAIKKNICRVLSDHAIFKLT